MRKVVSMIGSLLVGVTLPALLFAGNEGYVQSMRINPKPVTQASSGMQKVDSRGDFPLYENNRATVVENKASVYTARDKVRGWGASSPASVGEVAGEWVQTFTTLVHPGADGGKSVTIEAVDGEENAIRIVNFYEVGAEVKAELNFTDKTLTIQNQNILNVPTYGWLDIAAVSVSEDGSLKPDRSKPIEGKLNEDGTISILTEWGVFGTEGEYADMHAGIFSGSKFERANATMSQTMLVLKDGTREYQETSYNVIAEYESANVLAVKNFGNYGMTVDLVLGRDETVSIEAQVAREDDNGDDYLTNSIVYDAESGFITGYSGRIVSVESAEKNVIAWKDWTMTNSTSYLGILTEGKLTMQSDIVYPTLPVSEFEGEGTEASPYLIKTTDDLFLLAEKVNSVPESEYNAVSPEGTKYADVYSGKFFRLVNDLDMSGLRFTPIGKDWYHHFSGTFDGNGRTITGLDISTGEDGYAALFGRCGASSMIKNLRLVSPVVRAANYYAASVAGWSDGVIESCHVENADIYNTGRATGGMAAIVRVMKNSSVSGSTITGLGGNAGGMVSEVDELIENCHATESLVVSNAPGEAFNVGGLVATLYEATARNCYFSGTVDGSSYKLSLNTGGLVGICYKGKIEKCFSVGTVTGYGANANVGGLVGILYGDVSDSYSIGRVSDELSVKVGGLAGYVSTYQDTTEAICQSSVRNCYTSSSVTANIATYDVENDMREIIGAVQEGATPEIENIYFDRQMTSFGSVRYGVNTADLAKATALAGFDASLWVFTEGQYPRLKDMDANEAAYMGASVVQMQANNSLGKLTKEATLRPLGNTEYALLKDGVIGNDGYFSEIADGKLRIKTDFGTDTLVVRNGKVSIAYAFSVAPIPFEGEGTKAQPYLLKTKDDILKLADYTNNKNQNFKDTYFLFANDIDMGYDPAFDGISSDAKNFDMKFAGKIDGGGYALKRLLLNRVLWKVRPEDDPTGAGGSPDNMNSRLCGGFVGRLDVDGEVRNLTIAADARISFWGYSGPIVAYNWGVVDNCANYADVYSYSSVVGGLVGRNETNGKVTNCYNEGNVYGGYDTAGGITGYNCGYVENCANAGSVIVESISQFMTNVKFLKTAGGIVGHSNGGIIRNVVNGGYVYAIGGKAGGIAGSYPKVIMSDVTGKNDMYNALNFGTAQSSDPLYLGAISGDSGTQGTIQSNFWDAQILPIKAIGNQDMEGMTGVETSQLLSGKALDGFDTGLWDFTAGQYPVLKQFADREGLQRARKAIVSIPEGLTAKDLSQDAVLAEEEGLVWSLRQQTVFKIEGSTLRAPEKVTELAVDTLVATYGNYVKLIEIKRIPDLQLAGEGTEANPYQIASADDWNALSEYMELIGEPFKDRFFKLMADIDFTDVEFRMLASDGITSFEGNLDGDGKKISGIKIKTTESGQGAIRILGESGVVSNLTLAGDVEASSASSGGFSGSVYGTMVNCVNEINVASTSGNGVSGFGKLFGTARMTDCVNKGMISGKGNNIAGFAAETEAGVRLIRCGNEGKVVNNGKGSYTGGLLGTAMPMYLEDCYNSGEIEITDLDNTKNVAGLIGFATSNSSCEERMELVRCYNTADVQAAGAVAGLIAASSASSSIINPMTLTECYNTGNISAQPSKVQSSSGAPTAGLVAFYTPGSKFTGCWNSGTLSTINVYTAGIAAYYRSAPSEEYPVVITDCYNIGEIATTGDNGGGILAYCHNFMTVENCYNTANISGDFGFGGIVGNLIGEVSVIRNCWNSGNIDVLTNRAGGIVGHGTKGNVENCFNVGDVTSSSTEGGTVIKAGYAIGGLAGQGGAAFTNCYNMGTVTGASQVGGLIGVPFASVTKLIRCYNAGKIVAEADTCGALIGANILNGKIWNENNEVRDSYYVTDYGTYTNNHSGTAVTLAELAALDMGEGWSSNDDYTMPIPTSLNSVPVALVNAVTLGFAEGDSQDNVTRNFFVGAPEGLQWTASVPNITISGMNAEFTDEAFIGEAILTASAGELTREFTIVCNKEASSSLDKMDGVRKIESERWFNAAGIQVPKPTYKDGAVYLVIRVYTDKTTEVVKIVNAD